MEVFCDGNAQITDEQACRDGLLGVEQWLRLNERILGTGVLGIPSRRDY
jgi:hypothetical protein